MMTRKRATQNGTRLRALGAAGWITAITCCAALLMSHTGVADAQKTERDYSKMPGFVDFQVFGFDEDEALVEIYLHDALLDMLSKMTGGADPELGEVFEKLELVRVQKYELEETRQEDVEKKIDEIARKLSDDDWMRVVRVRERHENVHVYFKLADELLKGIAVMAVEYDEVTFVNVVGEIDPEQVGRLGRRFNIDELDGHWMDDWDQGRDRRRQKRERDR